MRHDYGLKHVGEDGHNNSEAGKSKNEVSYSSRQEVILDVEKRILAIAALTYINRI